MTTPDPWKALLKKVRHSASTHSNRSRTKEVHITVEDLKNQFNKQNGRCYWLGIPINIHNIFIPYHPGAPSVDRLNNKKDYTPENIVICTTYANLGRGLTPVTEMKEFLKCLRLEDGEVSLDYYI